MTRIATIFLTALALVTFGAAAQANHHEGNAGHEGHGEHHGEKAGHDKHAECNHAADEPCPHHAKGETCPHHDGEQCTHTADEPCNHGKSESDA
jgi:hypothetical protein